MAETNIKENQNDFMNVFGDVFDNMAGMGDVAGAAGKLMGGLSREVQSLARNVSAINEGLTGSCLPQDLSSHVKSLMYEPNY